MDTTTRATRQEWIGLAVLAAAVPRRADEPANSSAADVDLAEPSPTSV